MLIDPTTGYIDPTVFDRLREQAQAARRQAIASAFVALIAGVRGHRRDSVPPTMAADGKGLRCGA